MAILNLDGLTYFTTKIKQYIEDKILNKVDKVNGKGLSSNDLTDILKKNYDVAYTHSQSTHARTDATKVESSSTNGNIKINDVEIIVYTHPEDEGVSTNQQEAINNALSEAKEYTDDAISSEVTARNTAIDGAVIEANTYTDNAISGLINGAPTTLDTLGEIASAMSDNADVVDALNEAIGTKANQSDLLSHTHNYAGSSSIGGIATSAAKLSNTSAIGSATQPVYFSADGVPVAGTYTLGEACAKGVSDSTSASALSTGSNLVTERDVYYGTPTINGVKTYTSGTSIYAPTTIGTSGQVLKSSGNGAPVWGSIDITGITQMNTITINSGTSVELIADSGNNADITANGSQILTVANLSLSGNTLTITT